ncbi:hypothetical protein O5D80_003602 [Batrachochytrium dendrobatidis]|nr:hypothetical protein O5D80_003602 [Batrachochytrium dendrobatidis]
MMASELWVKLGSYNAVEVSTEGCRNVDKFLKACKRELSHKLGAYDSAQLSLSTTAGGPALEPDAALPAQNTAKAPLFISVADSSAQRTTGADMNIVTNAFPPLGRRQLYSSAKSTTRRQSIYGITVQVEIGNFGILQELKLERLNKTGSLLWTEVVLSDRNTLDNWSGEIDIQTYVKNALKDCSRVCSFLKSLDVYREQTFSFAQIMDKKQGNRADAIVFVKDTAFITGVAEVKVPGSNLDDIYQIVDYMVDLRNSFNVRYVFGVYTTYEEWKILWFEDSQEAAESDSKKRYDELCLAGSANEYAITEGAVKIFQSKTYRFCDPELIECLATLLYKVSRTPVYNPTKFIDDRSRYVYATATSIQYKSLPKRLEYFKYAMPPKQTRNFYILSYFHRGGDGRVVLVTSESGNLAVIKFLYHDEDLDALRKALEDEQNRWETLWQVQCRIVDLNGRSGLLMPFCMPFNPHRCKFSSLQTWNKISSKFNYDLLSEELENCVNTQQLDAYQVSPLLAAKEALSTVADKLSSHMDLCFRHVALLPKRNSQTDFYDFQAILIDLTRVESELDPQVAHSRAAEGYAKLELELDQIKKAFPN